MTEPVFVYGDFFDVVFAFDAHLLVFDCEMLDKHTSVIKGQKP